MTSGCYSRSMLRVPDSDFDPLRQEMAEISIRPAARLDVDPAAIPKAPMRRPTTQEDLEENFSGLVAFASWIAGRER